MTWIVVPIVIVATFLAIFTVTLLASRLLLDRTQSLVEEVIEHLKFAGVCTLAIVILLGFVLGTMFLVASVLDGN